MQGCRFGKCEREKIGCCMTCVNSEGCEYICGPGEMKDCQSLPDKGLIEVDETE